MTEQQVVDIILEIINRFKNKYAFDEWEPEDIAHEAYFICIDALARFKPEVAALENFLSTNLSRRLKNFKRDKNVKKIAAQQLMPDFDINEHVNIPSAFLDECVNTRFDIYMRDDYLKVKAGVKIPRIRLKNLKIAIREILAEIYE